MNKIIEALFIPLFWVENLFKSDGQRWREYCEWKDRYNRHKHMVRLGLKKDTDSY